jgi:hypothetical protein
MRVANVLPAQAVSWLDGLADFMIAKAGPVLGASSTVFSSLTGGEKRPPAVPGADLAMVEFEEDMLPKPLIKRVYSESTHGLSGDALLTLRKGGAEWEDWRDMDTYVPMLAAKEEERAASAGTGATPSALLEIDTFLAETDVMIGETAGPKWWNDCWKAESRGERIRYHSETVKGTDHDSVLSLRFGIAERIFQKISGINEEEAV